MAERRMKLRLCSFESASVWEGLAWHEQPRPHIWGGREIKSAQASNLVLMFHKDLEFFKLFHSKVSLKHNFSILEFMVSFPLGRPCQSGVFPVSHMHLRRCQFSICGLKTTSGFSFACARVIYVSKLKHKGYPPPVAFTGQATGGPGWWGLLFLAVRKSVTAESNEKGAFCTTVDTLK